MEDPRKAYLKEMVATRGYVLDYHKVLVAEDLPFIKAVNTLLAASYTDQRSLERKTKELIFTAMLTALGAGKEHIQSHIKVAVQHGATKQEVLETVELCALPAGIPKFMIGYEAWKDSFSVERVELDEK